MHPVQMDCVDKKARLENQDFRARKVRKERQEAEDGAAAEEGEEPTAYLG